MDIRPEDLVKSVVTEKESIEFMSEGLKQAASAARELAVAQNHPIWADIALLLMELREDINDNGSLDCLREIQPPHSLKETAE